MAKIRTRRKPLGYAVHVTSAPIKGAVVVKSNSRTIEKMNRELRKKCEKQRENDAVTDMLAATLYAGV